jgi:hypothetical protein
LLYVDRLHGPVLAPATWLRSFTRQVLTSSFFLLTFPSRLKNKKAAEAFLRLAAFD